MLRCGKKENVEGPAGGGRLVKVGSDVARATLSPYSYFRISVSSATDLLRSQNKGN